MSEYTEIRSRDGNQVFRLRYNNKALRWFERQTGLKFLSIDPNKLGLDEVSHLAAAGLIHENPDITIDAVGMEAHGTNPFEHAYDKVKSALMLQSERPAVV